MRIVAILLMLSLLGGCSFYIRDPGGGVSAADMEGVPTVAILSPREYFQATLDPDEYKELITRTSFFSGLKKKGIGTV